MSADVLTVNLFCICNAFAFRCVRPVASGLSPLALSPEGAPSVDYQVHRCTRHCTVSGREIRPGETFYSTLVVQGADVIRQDYAADAWSGPPEGVLGWWQSTLPTGDAKRVRWAPNDVMLDLVEEWSGVPERTDMCYVLALLLVRRRSGAAGRDGA